MGQVWDFIRSQSGLWIGGHNVFLYHQPKELARLLCDVGVVINRTCEPAGRVYSTRTPGGDAGASCDACGQWMLCTGSVPRMCRLAAGCRVPGEGGPREDPETRCADEGSRPRGVQLAPLRAPMLADTSDRFRHERVPV